jgi:L,D-transpeptidase catalytic domain/Putative peptidoglycan binding domain
MGITYGSFSTEVRLIQEQLDVASSTRLPRLRGEAGFGPLTMARVMEFQAQEGLAPDGDVGPTTKAHLAKRHGNHSLPLGRCILADLINQRLLAFENGVAKLDIRPIKGGARTDPTTRGVFKVLRRFRHHTSSKYPIPPGNMDFALFFHGAEAIHQGPPTVPSHGCIHVEPSQAERLFNWAGKTDITVIVLKRTR